MKRKIYLIGSLRNPKIQSAAKILRDAGHEVFDDWYAAGPTADDEWQNYENVRGRDYISALNSHHARHAFALDKQHLDGADTGVLLMPAGKSAHLELGYLKGQGKDCHILLEEAPARFELMYRFANGVWWDIDTLVAALAREVGNVT